MKTAALVFLISMAFFGIQAQALEKLPAGQARIFYGLTFVQPTELNSYLKTQNYDEFSDSNRFGLEVSVPLAKYFNLGLRYQINHKAIDGMLTDASVNVTQQVWSAFGRVPYYRTDFWRGDIFGSIGRSDTIFRKKGSPSGTLSNENDDKNGKGSWALSCGSSLGFGFKQFFLVAEAGYEWNQVGSFTRSGSISAELDDIDMSGPYITLALMFDNTGTSK